MRNNLKSKYQQIIVFFVIVLAMVFIPVPWLINWMFKVHSPFNFFAVEWEASDALQYFGSALGGLGTIFLGIITIMQTKQIKATETDRENSNVKRPFFIIERICNGQDTDSHVWGHDQNGYSYKFNSDMWSFITVRNIGDGVANNLIIEPWGFGDLSKEDRPNFCIPSGNYCNIPIHLSTSNKADSIEKLNIIYENLIGYAYSQEIELSVHFSPKTVGGFELADNTVFEQEEQYKAQVYNIRPQVAHGMGKYCDAKGKYLLD